MKAIDIDINRMAGNVTVELRVTGLRRWNLRMRLAIFLFKVAAIVAPVGMSVSTDLEGR